MMLSRIQIQILVIAVAFIVMILLMAVTKKITKKVSLVKSLDPNRKKVVLSTFYFIYYALFSMVIILTLGIDLKEVSIFLSSVMAIIGVAFFAQWSLLSNLTSSVIIFFYYPLKIGNKIRILDKEIDSSGVVINITGFYVMLKTDKGEEISIPNSIILQRGIQYLD